jgi:hypothetical protein
MKSLSCLPWLWCDCCLCKLLVEPDCETTQSLCPWDHVVSSATRYVAKALSWQLLSFFKWFNFSKTKSQDLFWHKGFSKLSTYKPIGIYTLVWSHYFANSYFTKHFTNSFQNLLWALHKKIGDVLVSLVSWRSFNIFTPLFKILLKTLPWHDHLWASVPNYFLVC